MSIAETEADVRRYYVTPSYVARLFGVSRLRVYRAINDGKLTAVRVRGGSLVLDSRLLPPTFPE
jgi:excisionase family DNA binding protein